jgi:hypothetical protein
MPATLENLPKKAGLSPRPQHDFKRSDDTLLNWTVR